mgnify:CR=1 FL=1
MDNKNLAESLEHWAKLFSNGTLDDSNAEAIAYLLEDKAHDLRLSEQAEK